MDCRVEVLTIPVSNVERATEFYTNKLGFVLDVDYFPGDDFRVVQLTPAGSRCSVQLGVGLTSAPPGSAQMTHLIVCDIELAHVELLRRGVDVGEIRHKAPEEWRGRWDPGPNTSRQDYASAFEFADPDGNTWRVQEVGFHSRARAPIQLGGNADV
jgi:catechol 2,3-dioxygenase-like lactoylglutathione lyase family enzyme